MLLKSDRTKLLIKKIIEHKASQNFIIIAFVAGLQIVTNVILGRELSKDDFGKYSFIFNNIIRVLPVLMLFGQNASILRLFSSKNIQDYKWKKSLLSFIFLITIPMAIITFIITQFYHLESSWFAMIFVGSFFLFCTTLLIDIIRSQGKFNSAILLDRANTIVFFFLLLIAYFIFRKINLGQISIFKMASFSVGIPFFLYILFKWKEGHNEINKKIFFEGLALWELVLTVIVLTNIDAFFIVKILDYKELALYSIIGFVMQIYDFGREAIFSVYSQKYAKFKNIDSAKIFKILILISIVLTIFYLISTNFILWIFFEDKYKAPLLLVFLFCIYYSINLLYVIPSCYLLGRSSKKEIQQMMGINISSTIIKISLIFLFAVYGLTGFLLAGIISQGLRTLGGYYISFRRNKSN